MRVSVTNDPDPVVVPLFGSHMNSKIHLKERDTTEEEQHALLMQGLEQVVSEIADTPDITGAFVITLGSKTEATSYAMGELPSAQIYTALGMSQKQILDIINDEYDSDYEEGI